MTTENAWIAPARKIVQEFEGRRLEAYPDPLTKGAPWTIGDGITRMDGRAVQPGDRITAEKADQLLDAELAGIGTRLSLGVPNWALLNPNQRAALASFAFNQGDFYRAENFDTINKALRSGRLVDVPAAMMLYINAGTSAEYGLRRRREAEGDLWKKPATAATGLVGPTKKPQAFGFKAGDSHLVVNDASETLTAWTFQGIKLFTIPALARGQGNDNEWQSPNTDTPPGLYKVGSVWRDYERLGDTKSVPWDLLPYGWFTLDLEELEGQERRYGRAGICIHGGGSALGQHGCWAPYQRLLPTHGCIRVHNAELRDKIVPLLEKGAMFVSVYQEA
jgi:GH24 family phage-related lysozyme (muramidase)